MTRFEGSVRDHYRDRSEARSLDVDRRRDRLYHPSGGGVPARVLRNTVGVQKGVLPKRSNEQRLTIGGDL
jgi:hypothetical protein